MPVFFLKACPAWVTKRVPAASEAPAHGFRRKALLALLVTMCELWMTQPASTASSRFEDWELVCPERLSDAPAEPAGSKGDTRKPVDVAVASMGETDVTCRLQQAQAVNGGRDVVFLFNVVMQEGKPIAIISAPLNVYLPAGLELRIDGGGVRRAVFETCNVAGCHAGFALDGTLLNGLRRGNVLTVTMRDTKATQIPVAVSLKGVTAGLKALAGKK